MRRKSNPNLTNRSKKLRKPTTEIASVFTLLPGNVRDGILQIDGSPINTLDERVLVSIPARNP